MKALGVFGGTFDPIHYGHLALAEAAYRRFSLDKIIFIPANDPPHKDLRGVTSFSHRLAMVHLVVDEIKEYEVSEVEAKRSGKSYTVDTIHTLREQYPDYEIYFLTGADSLYDLTTWHRWDELLDLCYFVTVTRKGFDFQRFIDDNPNIMNKEYKQGIRLLDMSEVEISSTEVRKRIQAKQEVDELVPKQVMQYIQDNQLYGI